MPSGSLPYVPFINQRDPSSGFHRSNGSTKYMNSTYIAHSTEHIAHIYSTYSKVQVKHVTELISVVTCWHQDIIHHLCFHRINQMLIFFDEFSILTSFGQIWRKYRVKYFRTCFTNFPRMRQEEAKYIFCRNIQNISIWMFIPVYWILKSKNEYSDMEMQNIRTCFTNIQSKLSKFCLNTQDSLFIYCPLNLKMTRETLEVHPTKKPGWTLFEQ